MGTGTAGEGMTHEEYRKAFADVELHVRKLAGGTHQLRSAIDLLRTEGASAFTVQTQLPGGGTRGGGLVAMGWPLSADDLAYLDRSWSARLAPLDAEIQEEVRRLSTTPLVELVEALEEG